MELQDFDAEVTVERVGPFALRGPNGELVATGKKREVTNLAREKAEKSASEGRNVAIKFHDSKGRLERVEPFYAADYKKDEAKPDEPVDRVTEAMGGDDTGSEELDPDEAVAQG